MKFEIKHSFPCSPEALLEILIHPRLAEALVPNMADLVEMELLERTEEGTTITRRARYQPTPLIKRVGPKKVEPRWMEWIEHSTADRGRRLITFENVPRVPQIARLLTNRGEIEITPSRDGCTRVLRGELKVKVPILGRIAEKMIYKQAQGLVDQESEVTTRIAKAGGVEAFLEA